MKRILIPFLLVLALSTFGQAGNLLNYIATSPSSNIYEETAKQLLEQSDGKLLAIFQATASSPRSAIARFTVQGKLDNTFGTGGFSELADVIPYDAALQQDGKIIVVGVPYSNVPFIPATPQFTVTRFLQNGEIDRSFATNGYLKLTYGASSFPIKVKSQPDGAVLVAGYSLTQGFQTPIVVRLTSAGTLDPSFSNGGKSLVLPTSPYPTNMTAALDALALQPDGNSRGFVNAAGSHTLEPFFNEIASEVIDPQTGVSVKDRRYARSVVSAEGASRARLLGNKNIRLGALGAGSDYSGFLQFLGIAV